HEVNEIRAEKIARVANPLALVAQQQQSHHPHTHPNHFNQNSSTRTHQSATRKREKAVVNSPQPIYDQEPSMVDDDDEDTSKDKEIDKLMALISLSSKKIYKPTNNNLHTSSNTSRANQDNSPRIHRNAGYEGQRSGTVAGARDTVGSSMEEAGIQLNAKLADWRDDTDDESDDQELEAHYMYMAKVQQVSPDVDDSGPIFDKEPKQKVQNDDNYDVFAIDCQHSKQSESVHNTYLTEQDAQSVLIESEDTNYDSEQIEQNDEDVDLAKEHFKTKNKSLTKANNKLSEVNAHLYADYKKSKDELKRRNTVEYATEMELECAKLRGELISNEMERKRYSEKDTHVINCLKQTVLELQNKLSTQQETISVLTQQKDAQIKLYKTRADKDIEKVIDLENKVKVLDNIVYKTGQSVQTMNMLNNKCRTSFVKPGYLKKAKQANPRLYDIDFKTKNKSLTEANNKLSVENDQLYAVYEKSKAELQRRNSVEYALEMELECAKVKELKEKLSAHQDTISILKQQKDAQIKLYKTREDKEIEKVIDLENKVKVLDNIVYKTGQSVKTMNMHNNKCRTSFAKPEYLKKAKQANPRLYDI
nr:hypothetical protein [Tanacetum cinerariifolium]